MSGPSPHPLHLDQVEIHARLLRVEPLSAAALAAEQAGIATWAVGGAVRDALLGQKIRDLDLAVDGEAKVLAGAIAAAAEAHAFELSPEFGTWRVVPHAGPGGGPPPWQLDLTALRAPGGIVADLGERDFTIGAMAVPLNLQPQAEALIDPFGGRDDLATGMLRPVSDRVFTADPLRLLRAARIAARLDLRFAPGLTDLAAASLHRAGEPAGERQLEELRLLVVGPDPRRGLALMDELGLVKALLPELERLRGVEQGPNHHLDVYDHTLAVLDGVMRIEEDPERFTGDAGPEVEEFLAEPLADQLTRGGALRFGALVHDLGKPLSRIERDGFIGFPGHDETGVEVLANLARRLHFSRRLKSHLAGLTRHHLRLGFLIAQMPLPARTVHDYLRATGDVAVDVTLLTVADRLAARGSGGIASEKMIAAHLELAAKMVAAGLEWRRQGPPAPLLRGDEVAARLNLEPGPELGPLMAELEAAQFAGEVTDAEQAVAHLRRFHAR